MPFAGYWDKYGYSPPSSHPSDSQDWATDIYAGSGTPVKVYAFAPSSVSLSLKVEYKGVGCNSSSGTTVNVAIYWNGTKIGRSSFSHLYSVPSGIATGKTISNETQLGVTHQFANTICYRVSGSNGVHTHFGAYNVTGRSCYAPLKSKTKYSAARWIGIVGVNNATHQHQACS